MSELTVEQMEAYVRARWEPDAKVPCGVGVYIVLDDRYWFRDHEKDETESNHWQAAYDFIKQREEEIRLVEEEIAWLDDGPDSEAGEKQRILAHEQERLAALKKGWRG